MPDILNLANLRASYAGDEAVGDSRVTVMAVDVEFEKTASAEIWLGGELTYTLTITNKEEIPLDNVVITDTLDKDYVTYVIDSITATVDGVDVEVNATYDPIEGILEITLANSIPAASGEPLEPVVAVITFRVIGA